MCVFLITGVIPLSYGESGCGQYVVVEEYDLGELLLATIKEVDTSKLTFYG